MGIFSKKRDKSVFVNNVEASVTNVPIKDVKMKEYAIDVCSNYIARTFSQSRFIVNDKRWGYKFNVRPNVNQSGAEFWREVIFHLFKNGDALVIKTDNNDLLLADDYTPNNFKLYPDVYTNVTVGDFVFNRTFNADEVFHFKLKNERLEMFTSSIYNDYEEIIGQMFTSSMLSNQLRFKANYKQPNLDDESKDTAQKISDKWVEAIKASSIVSLPVNDALGYEEINKPDKQALSISPIDEATWSFIDKVAVMLGIPAVLLHGDVAGVKEAKQLFYSNCLEPLNQLIEDEINAKIFAESEYNQEDSVKIMGANRPDVFEMADKIDKLISSGAFNRNELRLLLGYDAVEELDEYVLTLNYQSVKEQQNDEDNDLKGGENESE